MDIQLDIFDAQAIAAYVMADCPDDVSCVHVDIDALEDLHMESSAMIAETALRCAQWNDRYGV